MAAITHTSITAEEADILSLFLQLSAEKRALVLRVGERMLRRRR
jgi:hypothetical protein